jgi:hypothetical protein
LGFLFMSNLQAPEQQQQAQLWQQQLGGVAAAGSMLQQQQHMRNPPAKGQAQSPAAQDALISLTGSEVFLLEKYDAVALATVERVRLGCKVGSGGFADVYSSDPIIDSSAAADALGVPGLGGRAAAAGPAAVAASSPQVVTKVLLPLSSRRQTCSPEYLERSQQREVAALKALQGVRGAMQLLALGQLPVAENHHHVTN